MKHKTNVQFVKALMEQSMSGPMMQAFVIEAIAHYANATIQQFEEDASFMQNSFVHPDTWKRCAQEAKIAVESR